MSCVLQDPSTLLHTSNMTREEMDAKREVFKVGVCCMPFEFSLKRCISAWSMDGPGPYLVVQALASDPHIYERLAASVAPSIWQLEDVKKGILCQLFGGVSKVGLFTHTK